MNNDGPSEGLAVELAPLGTHLIVVEPDGVTGHQLGDPPIEAEAIIAAVDDIAEGELLPQRYGRGTDRRWQPPEPPPQRVI